MYLEGMTKQEQYQTLLDSLDFFEEKIQSLETSFDAWFAMVRLYELNAPLNPRLLKEGLGEAYKDLNIFYTKQLDTINLLIKFHKEEKHNPEVDLTLADDFLPSFQGGYLRVRNGKSYCQRPVLGNFK